MIYIIWDESHEWEDYYNETTIKYIGTDKERAINLFEKHFRSWEENPDDKWHYIVRLVEYEDDVDYYTDCKPVTYKTLAVVDNHKEPDDK